MIYFFIGTTAELIKISPVIRELEKRKENFEVISSNQNVLHFEDLGFIIKKNGADYTFRMKKYKWINNIYVGFVIWILRSVFNFYLFFRKRAKRSGNVLLIVQGDTVTALVGAVVAKLCGIKLVHIESGLRSFNFLEPFPEELSRFIISILSDLHFCPNNWSVHNLSKHKGIKINTKHNTLIESTFLALRHGKKSNLQKSLKNKKYFILVLHRQEHMLFHSDFTERLVDMFVEYARDNDIMCVFIMHGVTLDFLKKRKKYLRLVYDPNVILPPRMSYPEFVNLLEGCEFIATDGGSNQEEAYYLGKPCLILRKCTERIEGLGKNALLSKGDEKIISFFLGSYKNYKKEQLRNFYAPSKIIVDCLLDFKNGRKIQNT